MKNTLILAVICLFVACEKQNETPDTNSDTNALVLEKNAAEIIASANNFGFELFRLMDSASMVNDNLLISPLSISMALSMTLNGANGETLDEMLDVLGYSGQDTEALNHVNQALLTRLPVVDPSVTLDLANSVWYDQNLSVVPEFLSLNESTYQVKVEATDFSQPETKETINGWIEDNTSGMIKDMIKSIDRGTVMLLINAVYFNAKWQTPFDKDETTPGIFTDAEEMTHQVEMMGLKDSLPCFRNEYCAGVELNYGQGAFSMLVLVPESGYTADDLILMSGSHKLDEWTSELQPKTVMFHMPRFGFATESRLNEPLITMGMKKAFGGDADFTRMYAGGGVFIDYVQHNTAIEVSEEGTEASAATVVAMTRFSFQENLVMADHPFIFIIREKSTNCLLFIGKFSSPA